MSIESLSTMLLAPSERFEVGTNWTEVESLLGTRLPQDYKSFVERFGSGKIDDFMVVFNPFSANKFVNLIERSKKCLATMSEMKAEFPELYPEEVYPTPGGLLPFAATDNGGILYWRTTGSPDHWSVLVYEARGPKSFASNNNMTDFLHGLLSRSIVCDVLPRDFPSDHPAFRPKKFPSTA